VAGLGFMFSSGDPYTGIDLDNCVDEEGEIAGWRLR
jgi:primase-polymerase (primpol)-like protein